MSLETWEWMSYVVTVIGLPLAIAVFLYEQRKERENEEEEVYQLLSDNYQDFLKVALKHILKRLGSRLVCPAQGFVTGAISRVGVVAQHGNRIHPAASIKLTLPKAARKLPDFVNGLPVHIGLSQLRKRGRGALDGRGDVVNRAVIGRVGRHHASALELLVNLPGLLANRRQGLWGDRGVSGHPQFFADNRVQLWRVDV